jgi:hypothetical protein
MRARLRACARALCARMHACMHASLLPCTHVAGVRMCGRGRRRMPAHVCVCTCGRVRVRMQMRVRVRMRERLRVRAHARALARVCAHVRAVVCGWVGRRMPPISQLLVSPFVATSSAASIFRVPTPVTIIWMLSACAARQTLANAHANQTLFLFHDAPSIASHHAPQGFCEVVWRNRRR